MREKQEPSKNPTQTDRAPCNAANLAASSMASVIEVLGSHPVDTMSKRLQISNGLQHSILTPLGFQSFKRITLNGSLYQGLSAAFAYKFPQRTIAFTMQPAIDAMFKAKFGNTIKDKMGEFAPVVTQTAAGAITGATKAVLLYPLDTTRTMMQTEKNKRFTGILFGEGRRLYNGLSVTVARECIAFSALCGITEYKKKAGKTASTQERIIASLYGASAAVILTHPLEVAKTQMQVGKFASAREVVRDIILRKDWKAPVRGIIPRWLSVAPKLTFVKTFVDAASVKIDKKMEANKMGPYNRK